MIPARPRTLSTLFVLTLLTLCSSACGGGGASASSSGGDDADAGAQVEVFGDCTPKMPAGYPPVLVFIVDPVEGAPKYLTGKTLGADYTFSFKVPAPTGMFLEADIVTDANKNGACDDSETVVTTKGPADHGKFDLGDQADYPLHSSICPQVLVGKKADAP